MRDRGGSRPLDVRCRSYGRAGRAAARRPLARGRADRDELRGPHFRRAGLAGRAGSCGARLDRRRGGADPDRLRGGRAGSGSPGEGDLLGFDVLAARPRRPRAALSGRARNARSGCPAPAGLGRVSGGPGLRARRRSASTKAPPTAGRCPRKRAGGACSSVFVCLPGRGGRGDGTARVRCVGATRIASPWLEITACRSHWIDGLEGEPPIDWIRRQLGLADGAPIEPYLDRLLVRLRPPGRGRGSRVRARGIRGALPDGRRFAPGLDQRAGLVRPERPRRTRAAGSGLGAGGLRAAVDALPATPLLFQFGCPARGESLHGDRDLESAIVAHQSIGRRTLGRDRAVPTGTDSTGAGRLLVYSTVLAAVGRASRAAKNLTSHVPIKRTQV